MAKLTNEQATRKRALCAAMPPSQRRLLFALRKTAPELRFRKEYPVGKWSLDIYCHPARLAIEVDGSSHEGTQIRDSARDEALRELGIETIRVLATEILDGADAIAEHLAAGCRERAEALKAGLLPPPVAR